MQGATGHFRHFRSDTRYFNPRPLCRGRHYLLQNVPPRFYNFNPRPLCRGRPYTCRYCRHPQVYFNPRPLCRGRQYSFARSVSLYSISIHAPYAGGDLNIVLGVVTNRISIHAPYAGGDWSAVKLPYWEELISIHAPYAGGDHPIEKG